MRVAGVRVERGIAPSGCVLTLGMTTLRVEVAGDFSVPLANVSSFGRLLGRSALMQRLYAQLEKLAQTELSVLIEGETGTGKELAARALHTAGSRQDGPFVVLDCTTLQRELAPSRLFGHERGAFTGAIERKVGVFEAASNGTLFIDEVGELPLELQPMLLRVLQEREITPVGSTRARPVHVRVISATHRDLRALVNRGRFREDLYYRLVQDIVVMPALRQRRDDIELLVRHFLTGLPPDIKARELDEEALKTISCRDYPGNVRELQHVIERLAWLSEGPVITLKELMEENLQYSESKRKLDHHGPETSLTSESASLTPLYKRAKHAAILEFERQYLTRLLKHTGNNLLRASQHAGLQRHSLRSLLKRHGLYEPREEP